MIYTWILFTYLHPNSSFTSSHFKPIISKWCSAAFTITFPFWFQTSHLLPLQWKWPVSSSLSLLSIYFPLLFITYIFSCPADSTASTYDTFSFICHISTSLSISHPQKVTGFLQLIPTTDFLSSWSADTDSDHLYKQYASSLLTGTVNLFPPDKMTPQMLHLLYYLQ